MPYLTSARLENAKGAWEGRVRNISSDGMFIEPSRELAAGERLNIAFRLRHSRQAINMAAEVRRISPEGFGVRIIW